MFTENKTLPISAIKQGVVIDHVTAGKALTIIKLLQLSEHNKPIMLGVNLPSMSMETKDLIKLENCTLSDEEYDKIAILSPNATINIIEEYQINEKMKLELPDTIADIAPCPNAHCITNHEHMKCLFVVNKRGPYTIQLRCHYCRKQFTQSELI